MNEAVLIFTFSPIQPFISEARRASDLYVGSHILVELAKAAANSIRLRGTLIYPARISDDVPNKLVAIVPWDETEQIAENTKDSLLSGWKDIVSTARTEMLKLNISVDKIWEEIWKRQTDSEYMWEVYWAAASMESDSYEDAYKKASYSLEAAKRNRIFEFAEEYGLKDSLSGKREALHTAEQNAKIYWDSISEIPHITPSRLRPEGRERLDSIGAIKRFGKIDEKPNFFSTSTVAASDFLEKARPYLVDYRQRVEYLLGKYSYEVRKEDLDWPYDGDLLFLDTLTENRIECSYGGVTRLDSLTAAQKALKKVYEKVQSHPSPYYAIIMLDGDGIGKQINEYLEQDNPVNAHREFSEKLACFAEMAKSIVKPGFQIYNGGDDVLTLATLAESISTAQTLAEYFRKITDGTASAGIAIVHHLYPLDSALNAARQAENDAKDVPGKAAVCVYALKRGGQTLRVRSNWSSLEDNFDELVNLFKSDALASRFAYDVLQSAYTLPVADEMFQAELKRLMMRHRNEKHPLAPDPQKWAARLNKWALQLPENTDGLGRWLVLAHFVSQGGE